MSSPLRGSPLPVASGTVSLCLLPVHLSSPLRGSLLASTREAVLKMAEHLSSPLRGSLLAVQHQRAVSCSACCPSGTPHCLCLCHALLAAPNEELHARHTLL